MLYLPAPIAPAWYTGRNMHPVAVFITGFIALVLLFPAEFLILIRRLRRRQEDDIRRRVRPLE